MAEVWVTMRSCSECLPAHDEENWDCDCWCHDGDIDIDLDEDGDDA